MVEFGGLLYVFHITRYLTKLLSGQVYAALDRRIFSAVQRSPSQFTLTFSVIFCFRAQTSVSVDGAA
ncbi:MAG: hypothetical protein CYG60_08645 [Actinobacteria bacterium]|jgi:hypothetical protein|nr:MAG: hypothetical protein CYG60_08645 [Actinomycetota bacterium]